VGKALPASDGLSGPVVEVLKVTAYHKHPLNGHILVSGFSKQVILIETICVFFQAVQ
jgi:hypothetical protein